MWPSRAHLAEYAIDGALLALFMVAACVLAVLIDHPAGALHLADPLARRALLGLGMGLTAVALIHSPWGKRSGAHLNPAVTLAFLRLGRVRRGDAIGYVFAQLAGATAGVLAAWALLGARLAHPSTRFVVTRPGGAGALVAFLAEVAISFALMAVVLAVSGSRRAALTGPCAGALVFLFITFEAPLSGMSMNPARSLGSAVVAGELGALWIYLLAPPLGMLAAAALLAGRVAGCAKLRHAADVRCVFCGGGEDRDREPLATRLFRPDRSLADALLSGASLAIFAWAAIAVVLAPALAGEAPRWTAAGMRGLLPQLVGFTLAGAALGAAARALGAAAARRRETRPRALAAGPAPRRVVVLGGGFAGVTCARELERLAGADRSIAITLVSETNALLFTPMLAEVAGSSLEPTHISAPIRTALRRSEVLRARVARIDLDARRVDLEGGGALAYDHLVLALGAVSNFFGNAALERQAIGFRSLREAILVRNQVIDAFERAGTEADPALRRELLTFVVAGGGFAGVELAGALNDFARGILADYPGLGPGDVRVVLVHAGVRILPELSERLGRYALERMAARGVEFRLGARVKDARPGAVVLDTGDELRAGTLVWTAGARPNPLLAALPVARDRRGAIVVDPALAVPGRPGVWAAGDCAAVVDARSGRPCPPTAQFALREGRRLARNVHAALRGLPPRPFHFDSLGALCVVGHQTACAELAIPFARGRTVRFSGLLAWLLWRAIYLAKLPGLERKVRVATDWLVELFFPRDIVQTLDLGDPAAPGRRVEAAGEVKHAS
jgi:NADH dehydrogenase